MKVRRLCLQFPCQWMRLLQPMHTSFLRTLLLCFSWVRGDNTCTLVLQSVMRAERDNQRLLPT